MLSLTNKKPIGQKFTKTHFGLYQIHREQTYYTVVFSKQPQGVLDYSKLPNYKMHVIINYKALIIHPII